MLPSECDIRPDHRAESRASDESLSSTDRLKARISPPKCSPRSALSDAAEYSRRISTILRHRSKDQRGLPPAGRRQNRQSRCGDNRRPRSFHTQKNAGRKELRARYRRKIRAFARPSPIKDKEIIKDQERTYNHGFSHMSHRLCLTRKIVLLQHHRPGKFRRRHSDRTSSSRAVGRLHPMGGNDSIERYANERASR